jgi:hypothetical protein
MLADAATQQHTWPGRHINYSCVTKGGGALSQLESTIIPLAQMFLGVVIYVDNKLS